MMYIADHVWHTPLRTEKKKMSKTTARLSVCDLINSKYLLQLWHCTSATAARSMIERFQQSLVSEQLSFVGFSQIFFDHRLRKEELNEAKKRIHNLKNKYRNFGCEQAGQSLEELDSALESTLDCALANHEAAASLKRSFTKFMLISNETLRALNHDIDGLH